MSCAPWKHLKRNDEKEIAQTVMIRWPLCQRSCARYYLREIEGLSYEEIAP